jgi:hypothetical protein
MQQRQAVVAKTAARYQRSRKKEKSKILSELVELTEYSRAYARRVLRQHGQRLKPGKQSLVVDVRLRAPRGRAPCYDEKVKAALIKIWKVMDYICGKRMQPALAELVVVLERHNELHCDPRTRAKLLARNGWREAAGQRQCRSVQHVPGSVPDLTCQWH